MEFIFDIKRKQRPGTGKILQDVKDPVPAVPSPPRICSSVQFLKISPSQQFQIQVQFQILPTYLMSVRTTMRTISLPKLMHLIDCNP